MFWGGSSPGCLFLSCFLSFFSALTVVSRLIANYITFAVGEVLLLVLTICSLAAIFPRVSGEAVGTHLR